MTDYECKICHAVIPLEAKFCEHCETGFAIANEKWDERAKENYLKTEQDDFQALQPEDYIGEKI